MINVQKNRVTPAQCVIFVWAAALVVVAMLFFHFLYRPAYDRLQDEKDLVELLGDHLRWVTQTLDTVPDPQRVFEYFAAQDREFDRRFPDVEQKSLLAITEYAHKFQVRLERVHAEAAQDVLGPRGAKVTADNKRCVGVRVAMNFKSDYFNLVKYLETLRKVVPAYMVVEKMEIDNMPASVPKLEGKIDLILYLLV
jgi:hypothetical protein